MFTRSIQYNFLYNVHVIYSVNFPSHMHVLSIHCIFPYTCTCYLLSTNYPCTRGISVPVHMYRWFFSTISNAYAHLILYTGTHDLFSTISYPRAHVIYSIQFRKRVCLIYSVQFPKHTYYNQLPIHRYMCTYVIYSAKFPVHMHMRSIQYTF